MQQRIVFELLLISFGLEFIKQLILNEKIIVFYRFQADRRPHTTHCKKHIQQETLYHTLQYTYPTRNLTAHIATDMSNRQAHITYCNKHA